MAAPSGDVEPRVDRDGRRVYGNRHLVVRIPPDLREAIEKAAEHAKLEKNRTLTAFVIRALRRAVNWPVDRTF